MLFRDVGNLLSSTTRQSLPDLTGPRSVSPNPRSFDHAGEVDVKRMPPALEMLAPALAGALHR